MTDKQKRKLVGVLNQDLALLERLLSRETLPELAQNWRNQISGCKRQIKELNYELSRNKHQDQP